MTDIIDSANDQRDRELEQRIAAARSRSAAAPTPGADCRNECGDPAVPGSHYCSAACRDDYSERQERLRRQGKR